MSQRAATVPADPHAAALRQAAALAQGGDIAGADAAYRALYRQEAPDLNVLHPWGVLHRRAGDLKGATEILRAAVSLPGGVRAGPDLAAVLLDQGQPADAAEILRQTIAAGFKSANLELQAGRLDESQGRLEPAAARYRAAQRADANLLDARLALARVLVRLGRLEEAIGAFNALLNRLPNHPGVLRELAWAQANSGDFSTGLATLGKVEALRGDIGPDLAQMTIGFLQSADWSKRDELRTRLGSRLALGVACVVDPNAMLALTDDPSWHALQARCAANAIAAFTGPMPRPTRVESGGDRLRIGYLGGDFNHHPNSLMLAGVLEAHDRSRFEVFGYDYSFEDGSPTRARLKNAFEHFVPLSYDGPGPCADRIAADGIDILVDVTGHALRNRADILSLRPAPVQVNFLGHLATQGAAWVDYVIADPVLLPLADQPHWRETIRHVPHSALPGDRLRPLPQAADRAALGLPAEGPVFAAFNSLYRIAPDIFAIWLGLLGKIPGSVLWLYESTPAATQNLRGVAQQAGIDPARLIFTRPVELSTHISRLALADLYLDSFPFSAPSLVSDALWAGVPVVTLAGRSAASRAGASQLHAVGLPELVTDTPAAYEALALALAEDSSRRAALRARLAAARDTAPLFDAARFAADLEQIYTEIAVARPAPAPVEPREE